MIKSKKFKVTFEIEVLTDNEEIAEEIAFEKIKHQHGIVKVEFIGEEEVSW